MTNLQMINRDVRRAIAINELKYWQVAATIGIAEETLSRWLRHELTVKRRILIQSAIEKLTAERRAVNG